MSALVLHRGSETSTNFNFGHTVLEYFSNSTLNCDIGSIRVDSEEAADIKLSDYRLRTLSKVVKHEDILKEYGL